jgi:hypothetical protein
MSRLVSFGHFWWEFVIGDDWRAATAAALAVGATALLVGLNINAWWLLPPAVVTILYVSLRRATRN